ncbi:MAG: hypothetical protein M1830_009219 [Pleopsidium flavum]|nr:MAG: hypothetical protein M1830_009219 [Pleopsidium flavum]
MDSQSASTLSTLPTVHEDEDYPPDLMSMNTNGLRITPRTAAILPLSAGPTAHKTAENEAYNFQLDLLSTKTRTADESLVDEYTEELQNAPLFSAAVQATVGNDVQDPGNLLDELLAELIFPQYGLLAADVEAYETYMETFRAGQLDSNTGLSDGRILLNVNTPWSAFICGSQGSGKSHTLSCMLENSLVPSVLGKLPSPLAGIVFHYDQFTSHSSCQLCEAAYLCSSNIPVRILVSPTNYRRMKQAYENLPGLSADTKKPEVIRMLLKEKNLDIQKMMNLMAVSDKDGPMPLYMEVRISTSKGFWEPLLMAWQVVCKILRRMAEESEGAPGFNYTEFKKRLLEERFTDQQNGPLRLRLNLLESFMDIPPNQGRNAFDTKPEFPRNKKGEKAEKQWEQLQIEKAKEALAEYQQRPDIWKFKAGSLTIVDLSCPFVDAGAACVLFNICLALFLQDRSGVSRIVALDEAHKFMTDSAAATTFTENLLSVIRQQRHLATRVIIATQEPTISPKLLSLSSMTFVHRFTSPQWLNALKSHLAGASTLGQDSVYLEEIFNTIVNLKPGEALLFSPSAMLNVAEEVDSNGYKRQKAEKLGMRYLKIRVRKRLTADGGRSILAT